MHRDDIIRLAGLARIELTPAEEEAFVEEIGSILSYVATIKEITGDAPPEKVAGPVANVMREDGEPHDGGLYTEDLLSLAPQRTGQYIEVKKILGDY